MGFNDRATRRDGSLANPIFKPDVKTKNMAGKGAIKFRILPAYNKEALIKEGNDTFIDPMSWVPFRKENGDLAEWGNIIYVGRFLGHGTYKTGGRKDMLSLRTFAADEDNYYCPIMELFKAAGSMKEWSYLTFRSKEEGAESPCLSRPVKQLLCNIVDVNEPEKGVQLGVFSTSACNSLLDASTHGLATQRASNVTDEAIAANYISEWSVGDLTHPETGPVLTVSKGSDKGDMSGYAIALGLGLNDKVIRWKMQPMDLLMARYDISDLTSILNEADTESIIKQLVGVFNQRSPTGMHEYNLLGEVFGNLYGNLIPEPPSAPAASSTVAGSGFGKNPATTVQNRIKVQPKPAAPVAEPAEDDLDMTMAPTAPAVTAPTLAAAVPVTSEVPAGIPGVTPIKSFDRQAYINKLKAKNAKA